MLRLAREVHDAAGHDLAAVAMQAGVALLGLEERPNQARTSLDAIRATSTAALADLRATPQALPGKAKAGPGGRASEDAGGLQGLAALAANVQAAGLPVRLSVEDAAVPEATGRLAYRVQEALTNTLRRLARRRPMSACAAIGTRSSSTCSTVAVARLTSSLEVA